MRANHCSFMVDNGRGRCIAPCHYNRDYVGIDCTGADGPTMDRPGHFEVRVTGGFMPYEGSGQEKIDKLDAYQERMNAQYGI